MGKGVWLRSRSFVSRPRADEARAALDRAAPARGQQAEGRAGYPKKGRGLLREGSDMKFVFIAKHWTIWPGAWLCDALGVSRSGFHAWLNRSPSARSRSDEAVGQQVKASFLASDRTYGARRVWRDLLADGVTCGLHRIERLMRLQALRARPRRRRLPKDEGDRQIATVPSNILDRQFAAERPNQKRIECEPRSTNCARSG